ncbi:MAG: DUF2799 domain-containing protein [Gammaproteobacteria bacterium]
MLLRLLMIGVLLGLAMNAQAGSKWTAAKCETTDWHQAGAKDAKKGRPSSRISTYEAKCRAVGVQINTRTYQSGYNASVSTKCQPENGYKRGLKGDAMASACISAASYKRAHEQGKRIRSERASINHQMQSVDREIADIEAQVTALQSLNNRVDEYGSLPDIADSAPVEKLINQLQRRSIQLQDTRDSYQVYASGLQNASYGYQPSRPQLVAQRQECQSAAFASARN